MRRIQSSNRFYNEPTAENLEEYKRQLYAAWAKHYMPLELYQKAVAAAETYYEEFKEDDQV